MLKINLLKEREIRPHRSLSLPVKPLLSLLLLAAVMTTGYFIYRSLSAPESGPIEHKKKTAVFKSEETPFDVVEDVVDDIHGGRFKVKELNRLSSPAHLSPNEKKLYERLFVKNAFDAFNGAIQNGMGFNTITLDNEGNFFLYGVTQSIEAGNTFREELAKQDCILKADELLFKKSFGGAKTHFALKGFLNYNILERFYEPGAEKKEERLLESPENVLFELKKLGEEKGVRWIKAPEWGETEGYGAAKRHVVRMQIESTYSGLMKWINAVYDRNDQIGYSRLSLTSLGQQKILSSVECYLYAKN